MAKEYQKVIRIGSRIDAAFETIMVNKFNNAINLTEDREVGSTISKIVDPISGDAFALELKTRQAGAVVGDYAFVYGGVPYPTTKFLVARLVYLTAAGSPQVQLEIKLGSKVPGGDDLAFALRVNVTDQKLQYYNSAGAWADLVSGLNAFHNNGYASLTLIVDLENKKFYKTIYAGTEYDMSGIEPHPEFNNYHSICKVYAGLTTGLATRSTIYIKELVASNWF